ncbi:MAG: spore coat U domain-containing protein [Ottowia sp.]|uniref:Csu type fimbrial protein n=1 Tax=unclassified Ottowia TaxID=2645081 RepID=UPI003C2C64D0
MFKQVISTVALAVLAVFSGQAMAADAVSPTATATFQVKMTIVKACSVTAGTASDIDLGSVLSTAVNVSGSNTISVTCSKNTPYFIGLQPTGTNTNGAGEMVSATTTDKVPYQLHSASATGPVWGNTATPTAVGNGVADTGTGAAKTHTVYAVAASANFTPGSYADTVTVTINY